MTDLNEELSNLSNEIYAIYKKLGIILEQNEIMDSESLLLHRIQIDLVHDEHGLKELAKIMKMGEL